MSKYLSVKYLLISKKKQKNWHPIETLKSDFGMGVNLDGFAGWFS